MDFGAMPTNDGFLHFLGLELIFFAFFAFKDLPDVVNTHKTITHVQKSDCQ